jgi:uncharacterized membrane protein YccC
MSLIRADLRLALTAGLANAFATLSSLPFGIYMPLAVLAVCTGTFGGSMWLGQQRMLGSLLGMGLLILGLKGLTDVPFPLAIALILGALRLLGGLLGLEVGYKVGGFIIVMGWLVHDQQLASWVPLRLFWTMAGIVAGVMSMRLLWPARALPEAWRNLAALLQALAVALDGVATRLEDPAAFPTIPMGGATKEGAPIQALRQQLGTLRGGLKAVRNELGDPAHSHPQTRLLLSFMDTCSSLISALEGLVQQAPVPGAQGPLVALQQGEADVLRAVADRLRLWAPLIALPSSDPLRPPSLPDWKPPSSWQGLQPLLTDTSVASDDLPRLQRHAVRLVCCGQAERAIVRTEALWRSMGPRPRKRQLAAPPWRTLP